MKKDRPGTHSTQKKYFGTIPRSEFYGFVLGYAVGLFVTGLLRLDSQFQEILFACVGLAIGYWIDKKYFQEPDEPEAADGPDPEGTEEPEATDGPDPEGTEEPEA